MKKVLTSLIALLAIVGQVHAQVSFGHAEKMNKGWSFLRMDAAWNIKEQEGMKEKGFDDSRWRKVDLPHDWGVELPMSPDKGSCQGYLPGGVAWYRRHFTIQNSSMNEAAKPITQLIIDNGAARGQSSIFNLQSSIYIYFEGVYNLSLIHI